MALQASGQITHTDIATEFGYATGNFSLNADGVPILNSLGESRTVGSTQVAESDFYNLSAENCIESYTFNGRDWLHPSWNGNRPQICNYKLGSGGAARTTAVSSFTAGGLLGLDTTTTPGVQGSANALNDVYSPDATYPSGPPPLLPLWGPLSAPMLSDTNGTTDNAIVASAPVRGWACGWTRSGPNGNGGAAAVSIEDTAYTNNRYFVGALNSLGSDSQRKRAGKYDFPFQKICPGVHNIRYTHFMRHETSYNGLRSWDMRGTLVLHTYSTHTQMNSTYGVLSGLTDTITLRDARFTGSNDEAPGKLGSAHASTILGFGTYNISVTTTAPYWVFGIYVGHERDTHEIPQAQNYMYDIIVS